MRQTAAWTALATSLLAGCAGTDTRPNPIDTRPAPPVGGMCDAALVQNVVGQGSTATVVEQARVRSGARMVRILRPGQVITKEFTTQRLNLEVDVGGRIIDARCG